MSNCGVAGDAPCNSTFHACTSRSRPSAPARVPVALADDLSDAQIKAFRLLANKSANWAAWDDELLALEFQELKDLGIDLSLTGFDQTEIDEVLAEQLAVQGLTDPDAVPALLPDAVSRLGDLWLLGQSRLLVGDATDAADVERLLGHDRPHLMVSDPPYGVAYDPEWRNRAGVSATKRTGKVANDNHADWREAWMLFPGDVAYVWHAGVHSRTVAESLEACGLEIRSQIVWAKPRLVLSRGHFHWQHEPAYYAVRKGANAHWQGARDQTTLWSVASAIAEDAATVHGTQKPVELMRRAIVNNSAKGEFVYEPFAGSGSTIIAAETVGRRCLAIEIDPRYADLIARRWQSFTGQVATLDGDGRSFEQVTEERVGQEA